MYRNESLVKTCNLIIVVLFIVLLICFISGGIVKSLDVGYSFGDGFFSPKTVLDAFQLKVDSLFDNIYSF